MNIKISLIFYRLNFKQASFILCKTTDEWEISDFEHVELYRYALVELSFPPW